MTRGGWRDEFPGAGAGRKLAQRIDGLLDDLDNGAEDKVARKLRSYRWREGLDLNGVPPAVLDDADELLDEAHRKLESGQMEEARSALIEARSLFTGEAGT